MKREKQGRFQAVSILSVWLFVALSLACCSPTAFDESPSSAVSGSVQRDFEGEIDHILAAPELREASLGVKVVSVDTGETLYERNADKLLIPASAMKLVTSAAALVKLTPNYRFRTGLYLDHTTVVEGELKSDIYAEGGGDPTFSYESLRGLATRIEQMGIRRIRGDIVVDEAFFDSVRRGRGWMWDDGPVGGGFSPLSALSIDHNSVEVTISPGATAGAPAHIRLRPPTNYMRVINRAVTLASSESRGLEIERQVQPFEANILRIKGEIHIHEAEIVHRVDIVDPAAYCGTMLYEILARSGLIITGKVRSGRVPDNAVEIASHVSAPLSWIIREMNKSSDNFFAEMLLKALGAELHSPPGSGEKGLRVVKQFLLEIGIDPSQCVLSDGSGVSRYNLLSASMLTRLLNAMYHRFDVMAEYVASLPQGAVDGTLEERLVSSRAQGVLRAKTGTMAGVSALAGYVPASDGRILVFAILVNNFTGDHQAIQRLQDRICEILTEYDRKIL